MNDLDICVLNCEHACEMRLCTVYRFEVRKAHEISVRRAASMELTRIYTCRYRVLSAERVYMPSYDRI